MASMALLDDIGHTPLIEVGGLYVKLECANPGGSVKDRIAKFLLSEARRRGELRPGDTIVEATSGNTGIALSLVGREMGHPVVIYMPEHMSVERRSMIVALGAEVRLTPREHGFSGPIAARDAFKGRAGFYVPDQFANPDNTRCHELTTGRELLLQLVLRGVAHLDAFVAGVGTGGTLMGVARALRAGFPRVRVIAVEPAESNVLCGRPAGEHGIQGIGDGFVPELVERDEIDEVRCVSTHEALAVAGEIRARHGFCVGMSSGANTAVARELGEQGLVVATVWPDSADRYGSVGLLPPTSSDVRCPHRVECQDRMRELLGGASPAF